MTADSSSPRSSEGGEDMRTCATCASRMRINKLHYCSNFDDSLFGGPAMVNDEFFCAAWREKEESRNDFVGVGGARVRRRCRRGVLRGDEMTTDARLREAMDRMISLMEARGWE